MKRRKENGRKREGEEYQKESDIEKDRKRLKLKDKEKIKGMAKNMEERNILREGRKEGRRGRKGPQG